MLAAPVRYARSLGDKESCERIGHLVNASEIVILHDQFCPSNCGYRTGLPEPSQANDKHAAHRPATISGRFRVEFVVGNLAVR